MRELFEKPATSTHGNICTCSMCMKNKISDELTRENLHGLQSTMVDRRNPDITDGKPLMKATKAHAILKAGSEVNLMDATGISEEDLLSPKGEVVIVQPKELHVKANWKNRNQEKGLSGRNASVFGGLGVLAIPTNINAMDIPKMNARSVPKAFLEKYGAELIPLNESFVLDGVTDPSLENLYLIEYQWDADYIKDYVMNKKGGGGLFVETHPFPHVFTPLSPDCKGALILGVKNPDGSYDFAAFEIPFGYTIKIGSNVIHGDSFFVGPYAIALTETELADSVLIKKDNPQRDIEGVVESETKTYTLSNFFSPLPEKITETNTDTLKLSPNLGG